MISLAARTGWLWDPEAMLQAVKTREELCSTAMDNGVALLHPRRPMTHILERPFLSLGIATTGIPFGGSRSGLTDVFFLICSVDDRQHLRTLARLGRLLTKEGICGGTRAPAAIPRLHAIGLSFVRSSSSSSPSAPAAGALSQGADPFLQRPATGFQGCCLGRA